MNRQETNRIINPWIRGKMFKNMGQLVMWVCIRQLFLNIIHVDSWHLKSGT